MKYYHKVQWPDFQSLLLPVLFFLLFTATRSNAQCCTYTLSMQDTYGDGWNGGFLNVFRNDTLLGQFWASGFGSNSTFTACQGDSIRFEYVASMYENENIYQLYSPGWNLVWKDGPYPVVGNVFTVAGNCNNFAIEGNHPCNAIPIDTLSCALGDNTGYLTSGLNPNCAEFRGNDVWYVMTIPISGNLSVSIDSGSINDSGLAAWVGGDCSSFREIACDDDAGNGSYSALLLYNQPPGQNLYLQVFGYEGAKGSFRLCLKDLGVVKLDSSELPIISINTQGQSIPNDNKIDALMEIRYNGANSITRITDAANVYNGHIGIEVRGASSSGYPQQPYNLETRLENGEDNDVTLLDMPEESDWFLVSNFNDRSLVRNTLSYKLFRNMGQYAPRTQLCEVMLDSLYKGIYVFGEKIKRDKNRVDIAKLDSTDIAGEPVSGGYILQQNYWNEFTSFLSNYSPIDHPDFPVHFVYEYPKPDDILEQQKTYIAAYVDSLETALYSDDFADPETGYRKYLDVKSFIDYFLLNEVARNNDGFKKSVFFHKDRYNNGGKMKAGPVWDFDWAWKNMYGCDEFDSPDGSGWAHHINDCPTDNYSCGWYIRLLQDTTFANELKCTYEEYRTTMLDTNFIFTYIDSMGALVSNAQERHFRKWPILGVSGPAPEVGAVATTYPAELDTLKSWIKIRLNWLDANMPGLCLPTSIDGDISFSPSYTLYPNPGNGVIHIDAHDATMGPASLIIYNTIGNLVVHQQSLNQVSSEITLTQKGMYFYVITNSSGKMQWGKFVVI